MWGRRRQVRGDMRRRLGLLARVMAGTSAAAGGLALAGGLDWRLDILTHFAPAYVAAGFAAALLGLFADGRRWSVGLGAAAVVAGGALIAPEYLRPLDPPAPPGDAQLRIVQFNAFKRNVDLDRVVAWVVAQDPDIVTLQEARHDLRDALVRRTGWHVAGRHEHVMILSKARRLAMVRPPIAKGLPLTYVNATYPSPSGPFEVVTTHLDWPTYVSHGPQLEGLAQVVRQRPRARMIVTGDFNSTPWSYGLRRTDRALGLIRRDRAVFSFPTRIWFWDGPPPLLPIDHVYAGPGWRTVSVTRGPSLGSDHYPLLIVLAPASPR